MRGEGFYFLFPTHYVTGIAVMIIAVPVVVIAFFAGLFLLEQAAPELTQDKAAKQIIILILCAIVAGLFTLRNSIRAWRVRRRILRDPEFYKTCISRGYVRLV